MFQLLQSIGLLAIAGIAVPLIIHFWNVKQGKTLKIGSIALLKENSRKSARSWKLRDYLLLASRCLLIIILALLLAEPIWKKQITPAPEAGWVLVEKQNLSKTYQKFRFQIDSLRKAGYELHYFNPRFEKIKDFETVSIQKDTVASGALSFWTLLKELNYKLKSNQRVYLFTTNRLSRITGIRPVVNFNLHWYSYSPKDSVSEWISDAYLEGQEKIRLTRARSDGSSTVYSVEVIPATGNAEVETAFEDGKLTATLKNVPAQTPVIVKTSVTTITIFADRFTQDATYFQSALEAIRAYNGRNLKIQRFEEISRIPRSQDWLFWLSDRPIPERLKAKNRFIYKTGKPSDLTTVLKVSGELSISGEPIPLHKRIGLNPRKSLVSVWEDGFGDPILGVKKTGQSIDYEFYSRINPSWSDLPWREEFPGMIHDLLYMQLDPVVKDKDLRTTAQLQPYIQTPAASTKNKQQTVEEPLNRLFWLLAVGTFILERILSYRKRRMSHE